MGKELLADTASFVFEVPYKLIDVGETKEKPLFIYLHGFGQHLEGFRSQMEPLSTLEGYHLFIQGPYLIYDRERNKKVAEWGRAWYLYDGNQELFIESLEQTSEFLEELINDIANRIQSSKIALVGYSMGGYLAGYYALSRYPQIKDLVVIGSRIKTEVFDSDKNQYDYLCILAIHGTNDRRVKSNPQRKSCNQLAQWGADVTYKELQGGHKLRPKYLNEVKKWFLSRKHA